MRNYSTKVYDYIEKDTGRHVVKAVTLYAGKPVSAFAKCDPTDTFDYEFGKQVALLRLDAKIAKKRMASMNAQAKNCANMLAWAKATVRRFEQNKIRAEVAALDRKAEAHEYEVRLAELLNQL